MKKLKKLTLERETLSLLHEPAMGRANGGLIGGPGLTAGGKSCAITEPITACHITCPALGPAFIKPNPDL